MGKKKLPAKIEAEVMFNSKRECVVCDDHKRGDQIHHIDGNNGNNDYDNLALLCFDCHSDASITGSLKRKLSALTIIKYRDHKYKVVAAERENSQKVFISPIKGLTTEDLLTTSKNAILIIEIEKIKEEYFSSDWNKRADVIYSLYKFSDHTNFRVAVDVFNFLSIAADQARGGMTPEVAASIFETLLDYFPPSNDKRENERIIELANQCVNIGFGLVYDAIIHLKNYNIAMYGLTILKYIYKKGKQKGLKPLTDKVSETYKEIEQALHRPERKDLGDAVALVAFFKADIDEGTLAFPPLPDNLMKLINSEKKEYKQKKT